MQTAEQQKHRSNNHDWAEGVAEGRGGNERKRREEKDRFILLPVDYFRTQYQ